MFTSPTSRRTIPSSVSRLMPNQSHPLICRFVEWFFATRRQIGTAFDLIQQKHLPNPSYTAEVPPSSFLYSASTSVIFLIRRSITLILLIRRKHITYTAEARLLSFLYGGITSLIFFIRRYHLSRPSSRGLLPKLLSSYLDGSVLEWRVLYDPPPTKGSNKNQRTSYGSSPAKLAHRNHYFCRKERCSRRNITNA